MNEQVEKSDYEAYVMIESAKGSAFELFGGICKRYGFQVASLTLVKDCQNIDDTSNSDLFAIGQGASYSDAAIRCHELVRDLQVAGFSVRRCKVQHTVLDIDYREMLPSDEPRDSGACSILNEV